MNQPPPRRKPTGSKDGGQFAARSNSAPTGELTTLAPDPEPIMRTVPADQVAVGDLIVIGAGTSQRQVDGAWVTFDGRRTAEVTNVGPFGRRTKITFTRQDGSVDSAFARPGETFDVSEAVIGEREISE